MSRSSELINIAMGTTSRAIPSKTSRVAGQGPGRPRYADAQVQGVEGHREYQGPDRDGEEGSQNPVAEQGHREEKRSTDQHIEQAARKATIAEMFGAARTPRVTQIGKTEAHRSRDDAVLHT